MQQKISSKQGRFYESLRRGFPSLTNKLGDMGFYAGYENIAAFSGFLVGVFLNIVVFVFFLFVFLGVVGLCFFFFFCCLWFKTYNKNQARKKTKLKIR